MKHKQLQPSIILSLVAIAFFIRGTISSEPIMIGVGILILILALSRAFLILKLSDVDLDDVHYDDAIVKILKSNEVLYVEMLETYRKGDSKILYAEMDGILLYDEKDDTYHAMTVNEEAAKDMVKMIPQDYHSLIAYDAIAEEIFEKELTYNEILYYYNYVYQKREKLPLINKEVEIRQLDESYLEVIKHHYSVKSLANDTYLLERIKAGMLGAFIDEELVGYVGRHPSGAIGMIEVFEAFRNQKIAITLQSAYINHVLEESDDVIFTQVDQANTASDHIQMKLGFVKADKKCCWYIR